VDGVHAAREDVRGGGAIGDVGDIGDRGAGLEKFSMDRELRAAGGVMNCLEDSRERGGVVAGDVLDEGNLVSS
jgi:hypothetical protein